MSLFNKSQQILTNIEEILASQENSLSQRSSRKETSSSNSPSASVINVKRQSDSSSNSDTKFGSLLANQSIYSKLTKYIEEPFIYRKTNNNNFSSKNFDSSKNENKIRMNFLNNENNRNKNFEKINSTNINSKINDNEKIKEYIYEDYKPKFEENKKCIERNYLEIEKLNNKFSLFLDSKNLENRKSEDFFLSIERKLLNQCKILIEIKEKTKDINNIEIEKINKLENKLIYLKNSIEEFSSKTKIIKNFNQKIIENERFKKLKKKEFKVKEKGYKMNNFKVKKIDFEIDLTEIESGKEDFDYLRNKNDFKKKLENEKKKVINFNKEKKNRGRKRKNSVKNRTKEIKRERDIYSFYS